MDYLFDEDAEEIVFERLNQVWKKTGLSLSDDDQLKVDKATAVLNNVLQDMDEPDLPIVLAALLRVMMPMLAHIEEENWGQKLLGQRLDQNGCSPSGQP
jgi:hypothetical protein